MSNYGALTDEVLSHGFSDSRYRTFIGQMLNEGQTRIAIEANIRTERAAQAYPTVSGTADYALPSTFARTIDVRNSDDQTVLPSLELRDFDDLPSSSGKPYSYIIIGTNLTLYPTPDGVYNLALRFYKLPATMTASTDTPEIPAQYHHILVRYALMRAYQRENDFVAADYNKNLYREDLEKAKGELSYDTADTPTQIPGSFVEPNYSPTFSFPR